MANPHLLLVDEPSQGLAPLIVEEVYRILGEPEQTGVAILIVEQNALLALKLADRAYVLDSGRIVHAYAYRRTRRRPRPHPHAHGHGRGTNRNVSLEKSPLRTGFLTLLATAALIAR